MPIAIHENMLSGDSLLEKFHHAHALGAAGVEFGSERLSGNVPAIVEAIEQTGVQAAAVQFTPRGRFVDPDPAERERALAQLRQALVDAHDIGAIGVTVVPHYGDPVLPDLLPWMSSSELEVEMLYMHLRTLSDYSYAIGVNLYLQPVSRRETHLLNHLSQAARITRRLNHPNVKIAAHMYHMAQEETNLPAALREYADCIGHVHLADSDRRPPLPGIGTIDFAAAATALKEMGYAGWLSYDCASDPQSRNRLPASLAYLQQIGLS